MNTQIHRNTKHKKGFSLVGTLAFTLLVGVIVTIIVLVCNSQSKRIEHIEGIREAYFKSTGAN